MDIFNGLVVILLGAAMVALVVSPGTARGLDTFAAGFLPYRSAGWPHGVQEEDPVPWSWSTAGERRVPAESADIGLDGPEWVEISSAGAPIASAVDPGPPVQGTATRER